MMNEWQELTDKAGDQKVYRLQISADELSDWQNVKASEVNAAQGQTYEPGEREANRITRKLRSNPRATERVAGARALISTAGDAGLTSIIRMRCWADEGDEVDVERYRADPELAYRSRRKARVQGTRCITLRLAWGALGCIAESDLGYSGAVGCVLADYLEERGYRVRIEATMLKSIKGSMLRIDCLLKDEAMPLNSAALAAVLADGEIFRTAGFRYVSSCPAYTPGMGASVTPSPDCWGPFRRTDSTFDNEETGEVVLPACYSPERAREELARCLDRLSRK